jgi:hypothetical protein
MIGFMSLRRKDLSDNKGSTLSSLSAGACQALVNQNHTKLWTSHQSGWYTEVLAAMSHTVAHRSPYVTIAKTRSLMNNLQTASCSDDVQYRVSSAVNRLAVGKL